MTTIRDTNMSIESLSVSPGATTPLQDEPDTPQVRGGKYKKRLMRLGLHRIGSSSSVPRLSRATTSTYRGIGKGSISCISLNSAANSGYDYSSQIPYGAQAFNGYSTAPTSAQATPGELPRVGNDSGIRFVSANGNGFSPRTPLSIGLPEGIKSCLQPVVTSPENIIMEEDYFSYPIAAATTSTTKAPFQFWEAMPSELRVHIMEFLEPKQIVRCSVVSKDWHDMCFDGQLWASLDATPFYRIIPADSLVKIVTNAGPFARNLNLRGCVQLWDRWRNSGLLEACRNLENISIEGCRIDRSSMHTLLHQNSRLLQINLSGLAGVSNSTMKIIAQQCPRLEILNISWCSNVDTRGLQRVVESCTKLRDLRAGEVKGFDDLDFMNLMFVSNRLERLSLASCESLTDEALMVLIEGKENEIDFLTGHSMAPPRALKHLDLSGCENISDAGIRSLVNNVPNLEGLQLAKCREVTDDSLTKLFPTLSKLTHLDLEELTEITNASLQSLAQSPSTKNLRHLGLSYCEDVGDVGMLPIIKECMNLRSLELDNTRISDLVLIEATTMLKQHRLRLDATRRATISKPHISLRLVVYDCQNVTWTGIREILSRNADNNPLIHLKAFYGYQPTITEHTRRILAGDLVGAGRLERRWAEYMIASEEAGAPGGFGPGGFGFVAGFAGLAALGGLEGRRRRRRVREAMMMHADEEGAGIVSSADTRITTMTTANSATDYGVGGVGRRRRARSSGGCVIM